VVTCYSGDQYANRPKSFVWHGEVLQVSEVVSQWEFPSGPGFRVFTTSRRLFELVYRTADDQWDILELLDG